MVVSSLKGFVAGERWDCPAAIIILAATAEDRCPKNPGIAAGFSGSHGDYSCTTGGVMVETPGTLTKQLLVADAKRI